MARPTGSVPVTWRVRVFARVKAPRIRPTRSSPCRCAAPSIWWRSGAASRDEAPAGAPPERPASARLDVAQQLDGVVAIDRARVGFAELVVGQTVDRLQTGAVGIV